VCIEKLERFASWRATRSGTENTLQLQNNVVRVYGKSHAVKDNPYMLTQILCRVLYHPALLYVPLNAMLGMAQEIDKKKIDGDTHIATYMHKILVIFGNKWLDWLRKNGWNNKINENEALDILRNSSSKLPENFENQREVRGLGDYLFKYYNHVSKEDLFALANAWKTLSVEERDANPQAILKAMVDKKITEQYGTENIKDMDFARECAKWNLYPETFLRMQDHFIDSQSVPLPKWANNVFYQINVPMKIDGKTVNMPKYQAYFLLRSDPRGLFLGNYTNCCQHPGGQGEWCAIHGQTDKKGCFFVIEDVSNGIPEIIAQSWTWQAKGNRGIVFDNVESKGLGDRQEDVMQIYRKVAQRLRKWNPRIRQVTVGTNYSDLDLSSLPEKEEPLETPSKFNYYDAKIQRSLAKNKNVMRMITAIDVHNLGE